MRGSSKLSLRRAPMLNRIGPSYCYRLLIPALMFSLAVFAPASRSRAAPYQAGGYYTDDAISTSTPCGTGFCSTTVVFAAVPAGKTLVVTDVSCFYRLSGTTVLQKLYLGTATSSARSFLTPASYGSSQGSRAYASHQEVLHIVPAGVRPGVYLQTDTNGLSLMTCHIGGLLTQ
jgi:hypothetical protein